MDKGCEKLQILIGQGQSRPLGNPAQLDVHRYSSALAKLS
jgi:hypothetical protein